MKTYSVAIPVTGVLYVTVDADSEEDAIEKSKHIEYDKKEHDFEWERVSHICEGNVFCGMLNSIEAQEF